MREESQFTIFIQLYIHYATWRDLFDCEEFGKELSARDRSCGCKR